MQAGLEINWYSLKNEISFKNGKQKTRKLSYSAMKSDVCTKRIQQAVLEWGLRYSKVLFFPINIM